MRPRITPVVLNLLILNGLVFVVWNMVSPEIQFYQLARFLLLWKVDWLHARSYMPNFPVEVQQFLPVQAIGWFFSHISFTHILFNMLGLFFLGPLVEMVMGSRRFLAFYLYAGIASGLAVAVFDPSDNPVLGASGAISALLMAFAFYFPHQKLSLIFLPFIQFKAIHFALGVFVFSGYMVFFVEDQGQVSHFGHLMGMVAGILYFVVGQRDLKRPW